MENTSMLHSVQNSLCCRNMLVVALYLGPVLSLTGFFSWLIVSL